MLDPWHYWTLAMLFLLIAEAFVPGMVLGSLGFGALFGAVACAFTDAWEVQVFAAAAGGLLAFFALRPLAMRTWFAGSPTAVGVDALIGRRAIVTKDYDVPSKRLRVKVDGDDWLAECAEAKSECDLKIGTSVTIEAVQSNVLIVKPE
jgi:membrane protein implicated in regulation of membrane protease activity